MSKLLQSLISVICVLLFSVNFLAQSRWSLVGMTPDSAVWLVDKAVKKKSSKILQAWEKVIHQNGSYSIGLNEWKCSEKMKRLIQVNDYDPSGDYVSRSITPLPWRYIVPDSIEEKTYQIVCKDAVKEKSSVNYSKTELFTSIAQITAKNVKLMSKADSNSKVLRKLSVGEKLILVNEESVGVWYQVVDSETNSRGWLNGYHFKVVRAENPIKSTRKIKKSRKK